MNSDATNELIRKLWTPKIIEELTTTIVITPNGMRKCNINKARHIRHTMMLGVNGNKRRHRAIEKCKKLTCRS